MNTVNKYLLLVCTWGYSNFTVCMLSRHELRIVQHRKSEGDLAQQLTTAGEPTAREVLTHSAQLIPGVRVYEDGGWHWSWLSVVVSDRFWAPWCAAAAMFCSDWAVDYAVKGNVMVSMAAGTAATVFASGTVFFVWRGVVQNRRQYHALRALDEKLAESTGPTILEMRESQHNIPERNLFSEEGGSSIFCGQCGSKCWRELFCCGNGWQNTAGFERQISDQQAVG